MAEPRWRRCDGAVWSGGATYAPSPGAADDRTPPPWAGNESSAVSSRKLVRGMTPPGEPRRLPACQRAPTPTRGLFFCRPPKNFSRLREALVSLRIQTGGQSLASPFPPDAVVRWRSDERLESTLPSHRGTGPPIPTAVIRRGRPIASPDGRNLAFRRRQSDRHGIALARGQRRLSNCGRC
jgi:hypothetical protein